MAVVPEDSTVNVNLSELPGLRDDAALSSWLAPPGAELPAAGGAQDWSIRPMNQRQDYSGIANAASPLDLALTPNTITQQETVEQVLRSIATVRPGVQLQPVTSNSRPDQASARPNDAYSQSGGGISELILQSEAGGAALRSAIDLQSVDDQGVTFSIFGMGTFEFSTSAGTHEAALSELSSGWSARLPGAADLNYVAYSATPAKSVNEGGPWRPKSGTLFSLILIWVLDFVSSPLGILLMAFAGFMLLVWSTLQATTLLRRRPTRHRRALARLSRVRDEAAPLAHRKEIREKSRRRRSRRRRWRHRTV